MLEGLDILHSRLLGGGEAGGAGDGVLIMVVYQHTYVTGETLNILRNLQLFI